MITYTNGLMKWYHVLDSLTESWQGSVESNKACAERKLREYGYNTEAVNLIMRVANSEPGAIHPMMIGQQVSLLVRYRQVPYYNWKVLIID